MRYYKLLIKKGYAHSDWVLDKIYSEDYIRNSEYTTLSVSTMVHKCPSDWQEVPEVEYLLQEGKIEKWYIKGCKELKDYLDVIKSPLMGSCKNYGYYKNTQGFWNTDSLSILRNNTEITFDQFKTYILPLEQKVKESKFYNKNTDMKPQTFAIKAENKKLLEAIWDELIEFGYTFKGYTPYNGKDCKYISNDYQSPDNLNNYRKLFAGNLYRVDALGQHFNKIFTLPHQYQESLEFAKEQLTLWAPQENVLYFGKVRFTIEKDFAWVGYDDNKEKFGKATKEDISKLIDYIKHSPQICGYELTIHQCGGLYQSLNSYILVGISLGIGCEKGTLSELEAILAAF